MGKTLFREMTRWLKMRGIYSYEERVPITRLGPKNRSVVSNIKL